MCIVVQTSVHNVPRRMYISVALYLSGEQECDERQKGGSAAGKRELIESGLPCESVCPASKEGKKSARGSVRQRGIQLVKRLIFHQRQLS